MSERTSLWSFSEGSLRDGLSHEALTANVQARSAATAVVNSSSSEGRLAGPARRCAGQKTAAPVRPALPAGEVDMEELLARHGRLFSEQLGIDLDNLDAGELFKWFIASLLFGARIRESAGVRTYRAFAARHLLTPQAIAAADPWDDLLQIMAEGGYARYDGITSKKTQEAARKLLAEYGGDLNRLHEAAEDPDDLRARLMEFWGVGEVTAGIFLRELRGLWAKAAPPLGDLARLAADHLAIDEPAAFWRRNAVPGYDFRHFEAVLTRIGKDYCRRGRCSQAPIPHRRKDE